MTSRVEGGQTFAQTFDAENRLITVTVSGQTTQFVYDGDGTLVKRVRPDGTSTVYIGTIYEIELSAGGAQTGTTSYYSLPGARVQRTGASLYYVLTDHLGSASATLDASGAVVGEQRYYPFGETRLTTGTLWTDRLFTGQRQTDLGLYHFNARIYSATLGRFVSADPLVPEWTNPQSLNRYSYVLNNPLRYTDPTGYIYLCDEKCESKLESRWSPPRPSRAAAYPKTRATLEKTSERVIAITAILGEIGGGRLLDNANGFQEAVAVLHVANNRTDEVLANPAEVAEGGFQGCTGRSWTDCLLGEGQFLGIGNSYVLNPTCIGLDEQGMRGCANFYGNHDPLEALDVANAAYEQFLRDKSEGVDPTDGAVYYFHRCGDPNYGAVIGQCQGGPNAHTGPMVLRGQGVFDSALKAYGWSGIILTIDYVRVRP